MRCSSILRHAVIAELADMFMFKKPLSVNRLQKLIFLTQSSKGIYLYDFYMLKNIGPCNIGLDVDIKEAYLKDLINLEVSTKESLINIGSKNKEFRESKAAFLQEIKQVIKNVILNFGEIDESILNFCAMIVYIDNHIEEFSNDVEKREDFIDLILKNYANYTKENLSLAINYLVSCNFLERTTYGK